MAFKFFGKTYYTKKEKEAAREANRERMAEMMHRDQERHMQISLEQQKQMLDKQTRDEFVAQAEKSANVHKAAVVASVEEYDKQLKEAKEHNIDVLAKNSAKEFASKQRDILTEIVADVKKHGSNKKYVSDKYGDEVGAGVATHYCLIVQMESMRRADEEMGPQIAEQLKEFADENIDTQIMTVKTKTDRNDLYKEVEGQLDTLQYSTVFRNQGFMTQFGNTAYMDNVDVNNKAEKTGRAEYRDKKGNICAYSSKLKDPSINLGDYIDEKGYVRKDETGKPMLEDGALAFVKLNDNAISASGYHVIRVNVEEDGKVSYTAGNGDRIDQAILGNLKTKPCAVFHTQRYLEDRFKSKYSELEADAVNKMAAELYPDQAKKVDEFNKIYIAKSSEIDKSYNPHEISQLSDEEVRQAEEKSLTIQQSDAQKLMALRQGRTVNASQTDSPVVPRSFDAQTFRRLQEGTERS